MLKGAATSDPVRVTNGPLYYEAPAAGRKADQIFFVAHDYHARLEKYDPQQKEFAPLQVSVHADHVSFRRSSIRCLGRSSWSALARQGR